MGLLAIANGLVLIFVNQFLLFLPEDVTFVGMSAQQIFTLDPGLYAWAVIVYRLWGAFTFSTGVLTLAITFIPLRRAERWAWHALVVAIIPTLILWIYVNLPVHSYFLPALWLILFSCLFAFYVSYRVIFGHRGR